jgi:hypothetical protein
LIQDNCKITGILLFIGAILLGISTVLHPITIDPWSGSEELHKAAESKYWTVDHILMVIAMVVWLFSLVSATLLISKSKMISVLCSLFFTVALAIWLIILGLELTVFPEIFQRLTDKTYHAIGTLFFGYGLFSGYIAMLLIWIGISLLAINLSIHKSFSPHFRSFGKYSGLVGSLGIVITFVIPNLMLLALTSAFPYLWTIALSIKMINDKQ